MTSIHEIAARVLCNRWAVRLAAVVSGLGIVVVMLLPPTTLTPPAVGGDKLHHMVAFAVLGLLVALAWRPRLVVTAGGVTLYGAALELLQPLTGRHAELGDVVADAVGAVLGAGLAVLLIRVAGQVRPGTCRQAASRYRSRR